MATALHSNGWHLTQRWLSVCRVACEEPLRLQRSSCSESASEPLSRSNEGEDSLCQKSATLTQVAACKSNWYKSIMAQSSLWKCLVRTTFQTSELRKGTFRAGTHKTSPKAEFCKYVEMSHTQFGQRKQKIRLYYLESNNEWIII